MNFTRFLIKFHQKNTNWANRRATRGALGEDLRARAADRWIWSAGMDGGDVIWRAREEDRQMLSARVNGQDQRAVDH